MHNLNYHVVLAASALLVVAAGAVFYSYKVRGVSNGEILYIIWNDNDSVGKLHSSVESETEREAEERVVKLGM